MPKHNSFQKKTWALSMFLRDFLAIRQKKNDPGAEFELPFLDAFRRCLRKASHIHQVSEIQKKWNGKTLEELAAGNKKKKFPPPPPLLLILTKEKRVLLHAKHLSYKLSSILFGGFCYPIQTISLRFAISRDKFSFPET